MEATTKTLMGAMLVYVSAYIRIRHGKEEHVRSHFRGWPAT